MELDESSVHFMYSHSAHLVLSQVLTIVSLIHHEGEAQITSAGQKSSLSQSRKTDNTIIIIHYQQPQ
jgi:hypothetical protein